ncbi:hypothetical protein AMECASPLE_009818 [Ameca splendens]|uniref:Uncharacterized protein n=1 Tax=Ameca splendens TaxID=208324 RepID=A0ABV0Y0T1_9TELE
MEPDKKKRVCVCLCKSPTASLNSSGLPASQRLVSGRVHEGMCVHVHGQAYTCVCVRIGKQHARTHTHTHTLNIRSQHGVEVPKDTTALPRLMRRFCAGSPGTAALRTPKPPQRLLYAPPWTIADTIVRMLL